MTAREELRDEVLAALMRPEHAPMSDHTRDAAGHPECFSCPWPAHELPPEDLATVLADALLASPALARVIREAKADGYLHAVSEFHEAHPDHCGGECFRQSVNPYREQTEEPT